MVLAHEVVGVPRPSRPAQAGVPLVLLHAFPLDRNLWREVVPLVEGASCVVVADLPGLGDSPVPPLGPPSLDFSADAVAALLDDLDLPRAALAGVSMGGYVALAFARRHPGRLAGLGLIDTTCAADTPEAVQRRVVTAQKVLGEEGTEVLVPMVDQLLGAGTRAQRPEVVARVTEAVRTARPEGVAWSQRAMAARADTSSTLAGLHRPVAVVVGEEDVLTPPARAAEMARLCRDGTLTVLAGCGHLSPVERPAEVAAALSALVHRTAQAPATGPLDLRTVADAGRRPRR